LSFENCARLVEHFGVARTSRILLTGGFIDASEAAASGAVTKLTETGEIGKAVAELVSAIARNAPLTIRAAKAALSRLRVDRRGEGGEIAALVADCYASADFREGVSAFLAKRPPKFTAAERSRDGLTSGRQRRHGRGNAARRERNPRSAQTKLDTAKRANQHQLVEIAEMANPERLALEAP
jgi:hypothetical protein